MSYVRYPYPPQIPGLTPDQQRSFDEWASALIGELESRDRRTVFGAASQEPYIVTNLSVQRSLNVATVSTVHELAAVVGTLIADLKAHGDLA